ncbi:DUF6913 domain-containing protein [Pontimicrobium aquaticum]|uniref:Uncharacterized protein n=1 Tax=Pontimicrobium aquaticum TaxID=2565367 RepID=A0A4U0EXG9_9FLAO|nr:hypothetical protein [Pontimicrobium aquaticum]TJY36084.1 hypothetical protein E5167_09505 [Pontimicrobium aquaticum]
MFLKRFKEKSNQKYINTLLSSRQNVVDSRKIESVGIVLNFDEFNNYEAFKSLFKEIKILENKVKFIAFITDEKLTPNNWDAFFNPKNFGWNGKIDNVELEEFVNTEFDALISYYKEDSLELNLVTALSKANFKIGISGKDKRLHDFIIDVTTNQIDLFKMELIKYLKVLNKI